MEKISSLPSISRVGSLFSTFAKTKAGLLDKLVRDRCMHGIYNAIGCIILHISMHRQAEHPCR